jgi:hypothetical protein
MGAYSAATSDRDLLLQADSHQQTADLNHVRLNRSGQVVKPARLGQLFSAFAKQRSVSGERFFGVERSLLERIPATRAAGQIREKHAIAGLSVPLIAG